MSEKVKDVDMVVDAKFDIVTAKSNTAEGKDVLVSVCGEEPLDMSEISIPSDKVNLVLNKLRNKKLSFTFKEFKAA